MGPTDDNVCGVSPSNCPNQNDADRYKWSMVLFRTIYDLYFFENQNDLMECSFHVPGKSAGRYPFCSYPSALKKVVLKDFFWGFWTY